MVIVFAVIVLIEIGFYAGFCVFFIYFMYISVFFALVEENRLILINFLLSFFRYFFYSFLFFLPFRTFFSGWIL